MPGPELSRAFYSDTYDQAQHSAAGMNELDMHRAACAAGFDVWINSLPEFRKQFFGSKVTESIRMPFPSPAIQQLRGDAGYPKGVQTVNDGWSLDVSDALDPEEPFDTGVDLIACQKINQKTTVRVPLDIVVPPYAIKDIVKRPDRLSVWAGNRQLPTAFIFKEESAQRLLLIAETFLHIVANGSTERVNTHQSSWRRFLT